MVKQFGKVKLIETENAEEALADQSSSILERIKSNLASKVEFSPSNAGESLESLEMNLFASIKSNLLQG